jgi:hypothetical protein
VPVTDCGQCSPPSQAPSQRPGRSAAAEARVPRELRHARGAPQSARLPGRVGRESNPARASTRVNLKGRPLAAGLRGASVMVPAISAEKERRPGPATPAGIGTGRSLSRDTGSSQGRGAYCARHVTGPSSLTSSGHGPDLAAQRTPVLSATAQPRAARRALPAAGPKPESPNLNWTRLRLRDLGADQTPT